MSVGPTLGHIGRLLAALADSGRLVRGHELVEDGRVRDLTIAAERIEAVVWGSRHDPYEVTIHVPSGGELPTDPRQLRFSCTCPDWGDPCKHAVAVALAAANELDGNHRLLATLLGGEGETAADDPLDTAARQRSVVVATTIEPPKDRPTWAQDVAEPRVPMTTEAWLGEDPGRQPAVQPLEEDPTELFLSLGALHVGDGPDLAPSLQLLIYGLTES